MPWNESTKWLTGGVNHVVGTDLVFLGGPRQNRIGVEGA